MSECTGIGRMFKVISTYMDKEANNELVKVNLTRAQIEMLIFIYVFTEDGKEVNQVDIEKEFNLKNPTVTGILNRLEDKGYIRRVQSNKDKRYKKIEVSDLGENLVKKGKSEVERKEEEWLSFLTTEEKKELKRLLNKIMENI